MSEETEQKERAGRWLAEAVAQVTVAHGMILRRVLRAGGHSFIRGGHKTMIELNEGMKLVTAGLLRVHGEPRDLLGPVWGITDKGRAVCKELGIE